MTVDTDSLDRFENFVSILQEKTPDLTIAYKDESAFMKVLGKVLLFNKTFMTQYITTIGYTIYFPSRSYVETNPLACMLTVAHEYEHIKYSEKLGQIPYALIYLIPQILTLFAIPAAFFVGWYSLFFLLFLLPLPAYWRMKIELRGYTMTLFANYCYAQEMGQNNPLKLLEHVEHINKNFTGSPYYFMWPFGIRKKLDKAIDSIVSGDILETDDIYHQVKDALEKSRDTLI